MRRDEWKAVPSYRRVKRARPWKWLAGWFSLGVALGAAGSALF